MGVGRKIDKTLLTDELRLELEGKADLNNISWENIKNPPNLADAKWKSPVSSTGDLPASGNTVGDLRLVVATGEVYNYTAEGWELIGANDVSVDWSQLQNKPATFSPSAHGHVISEVIGLQIALDGKQAVIGYTPMNANVMKISASEPVSPPTDSVWIDKN